MRKYITLILSLLFIVCEGQMMMLNKEPRRGSKESLKILQSPSSGTSTWYLNGQYKMLDADSATVLYTGTSGTFTDKTQMFFIPFLSNNSFREYTSIETSLKGVSLIDFSKFISLRTLTVDCNPVLNEVKLSRYYFNNGNFNITLKNPTAFGVLDLSGKRDIYDVRLNFIDNWNSSIACKVIFPDTSRNPLSFYYVMQSKQVNTQWNVLDFNKCPLYYLNLTNVSISKLRYKSSVDNANIFLTSTDVDTLILPSQVRYAGISLTNNASLKVIVFPSQGLNTTYFDISSLPQLENTVIDLRKTTGTTSTSSISMVSLKSVVGRKLLLANTANTHLSSIYLNESYLDTINLNNVNLRSVFIYNEANLKRVYFDNTKFSSSSSLNIQFCPQLDTLKIAMADFTGATYVTFNSTGNTNLVHLNFPVMPCSTLTLRNSKVFNLDLNLLNFIANSNVNIINNNLLRKIKFPHFSLNPFIFSLYSNNLDSLDFSGQSYFPSSISCYSNSSLVKIKLPTGVVNNDYLSGTTYFSAYSCDLRDTLDFRNFVNPFNSYLLYSQSSKLLKKVYFPVSSNQVKTISIANAGLVDTLDLTPLSNLGITGLPNNNVYTLSFGGNPNLKHVKIAPTSSNIEGINVSGELHSSFDTLDLSVWSSRKVTNVAVSSNSSIKNIFLPTVNSTRNFTWITTGAFLDTIDIRKLNSELSSGQVTIDIELQNNTLNNLHSLKDIKFPNLSNDIVLKVRGYESGGRECASAYAKLDLDTLDISMLPGISDLKVSRACSLKHIKFSSNLTAPSMTLYLMSINTDTLDLTTATNIGGTLQLESGSFKKLHLPNTDNPCTFVLWNDVQEKDSLDLTPLSNLTGVTFYYSRRIKKIKINSNASSFVMSTTASDYDTILFNNTQIGNPNISGDTLFLQSAYLKKVQLPSTNNYISTLSITGSSANTYFFDLKGLTNLTNRNSTTINVSNNSWSAQHVNHVLSDIDYISTTGYTGRTVTITGNNAAPDNSSGGYDGIAAKNSLVAKGFTVVTN